ncbi:hypothetical protein GAYE_SCF35G5092 [Galdieria yellowstonensis]|uniref:Nucleotide exchange factor Fes1 domain-containing protein n=1 Tax=Galdieria yellowstonensis TaxID=3028027 RepID=A0AAV9II85_9RHOD|nr:hypothetical protein GAYE_SCF35G5092 [Galdieria yellowstonensis]
MSNDNTRQVAPTQQNEENTRRITRNLQSLLHWSIENSARDNDNCNQHGCNHSMNSLEEQLVMNRKWLDTILTSDTEAMRTLGEQIGNPDVDDSTRSKLLEDLEAYIEDINCAVNMDRVGALKPVLECLRGIHSESVRAKALEVVGSAMQDSTEVRETLMNYKEAIPLLIERMRDSSAVVRAKAVRAVSALLRNFSSAIGPFRSAKGGEILVQMATTDEDRAVRHRALFFLEHCIQSENDWFAVEVAASPASIANIVDRLRTRQGDDIQHANDVSELEAIIGALNTLASFPKTISVLHDAGLLQVLEKLEVREIHEDLTQKIQQLRNKLSESGN